MYKILYFLDYGKAFGGAVNTLINQAVLMREAGHQIVVFVSDYYGAQIEEGYLEICKKNNITLEKAKYHISSQPEDVDVICLTQYYDDLKQQIQEYSPDILHSVQLNPMVELISRECNIPHIMNIYPLLPEFFDIKYHDIFPHYHICDSEYWAKQWHFYLKTDYTCIRTSVNFKDKKQKQHKREELRFICVGDIYKEKNQLNVIKAFEKVISRGILAKLHLYGHDNNSYATECQKYIEEHQIQEFVQIKGFNSNIDTMYSCYDVLICGSTRESYPNAISEALANNLVVISTPVGGVPEVIVDGENGYLCNGYEAENISEKIFMYIETIYKNNIDYILNNVKKTYEEVHSPLVISEKLQKFYQYILLDSKHSSSVNIKDIEQLFKREIEIYNKNVSLMQEPLKVATKLWYLHYVKEKININIEKRKEFYIWGIGKMFTGVKDIVKIFFTQIIIKGYLDSNKVGQIDGIPIYRPSEVISNKNSVIFIAAKNGQLDIIKQLEESGKKFNKDYFILSERRW